MIRSPILGLLISIDNYILNEQGHQVLIVKRFFFCIREASRKKPHGDKGAILLQDEFMGMLF